MAYSDARLFPDRAVALHIEGVILTDATGKVVTTGVGTLSAVVVKDGVAAVSENVPTEEATNSGVFELELTAAEMDAYVVTVIVSSNVAGTRDTVVSLYTDALSEDVEVAFDPNDLPDFSTYFPDFTSAGRYGGLVTWYRAADNSFRTDMDSSSLMPTSGYTPTYVMPSAGGASDANDGSQPTFAGAGVGPKATMLTLLSDATKREIILEEDHEFLASQGWAAQALGNHKIVRSYVRGVPTTLTAQAILPGTITWAWDAGAALWLENAISSSIANVVLPDVFDSYGRPRVLYNAGSLAACQATIWTCWYEPGTGVYVHTDQNGAGTPPSASAKIHMNQARNVHLEPQYNLYCQDVDFEGGSVAFASINAAQITAATNASPIVLTTDAVHRLTNGDAINVVGVQGNTAANNTPGVPWYASVLSTTTVALYQDSGLTIPVVGNAAFTSGGYVSRGEMIETFVDCNFRYGGSSSLGSNNIEFSGEGLVRMVGCTWTDTNHDGMDGRNGRNIVVDNGEGAYCGQNGSVREIDQAITMHAGARLISCNSEYHHTGGPCTQNATEAGLPAYQVHLGDYFYQTLGVATPASNYGAVAGIGGSSEGSRIWLVRPRFRDRSGGNSIAARCWRANKGVIYAEPGWTDVQKTINSPGQEIPIYSAASIDETVAEQVEDILDIVTATLAVAGVDLLYCTKVSKLLRKQATNLQSVVRGTGGRYVLYDDDGTTEIINAPVSASDTTANRLESTATWDV